MVPAPRRTIAAAVVKWPIGVATRKFAEVVQILDVISRVPAHVQLVERWDTVVARVKHLRKMGMAHLEKALGFGSRLNWT